MKWENEENDGRIIEEQAATIRILTDLTKAGSWIISYKPDGSLESVQWGDGFRRLMVIVTRMIFRIKWKYSCAVFIRKTGML